ncbi:hypothetical protein XENTR_v10015426 [Xenopus tropicalis]|nr:hypothetical protein XENTR_v10015426 [Xenopus tropicalis]
MPGTSGGKGEAVSNQKPVVQASSFHFPLVPLYIRLWDPSIPHSSPRDPSLPGTQSLSCPTASLGSPSSAPVWVSAQVSYYLSTAGRMSGTSGHARKKISGQSTGQGRPSSLGARCNGHNDQLIPEETTLPTSAAEKRGEEFHSRSSKIAGPTFGEELSNMKAKLLGSSTLLRETKPSVYQLSSQFSNKGYRKYNLGQKNPGKPKKVALLVGATGSGKTTLINGMANYILGVDWEDDFRFKLVHEVTNQSEAHSQTSEVTAYVIHHHEEYRIPYSLTLIDTPGFGDTRGIEQDKKITEAIDRFFSSNHGIDQIDAVCFVVQSSLARLTHSQKYIFNSVFSIFGKDIKDNIMVLVNFSDGERPPVLDAIKTAEIPCPLDQNGDPVHFKFNNSALFADNQPSNYSFNQMFWAMGGSSMNTFFQSMNQKEAKSLRLTKEVLQERKQLEICLQALQPQIKAGLLKLEELRKTELALQQNKDLMNANKDFEYEVERNISVKEEVNGYFITNCAKCHFTCHDYCIYGDDKDKIHCSAITNGYCTMCPGECVWSVHHNQAYKFSYTTIKEKKTYAELKAKYEEASGEIMNAEKIFQKLEDDYCNVQAVVLVLIDKSSQSLKRLEEIALRPNPLTATEYIDLMIQSEEQEAKPGFQERIQSLKAVREDAEIIRKISSGEALLPEQHKHLQESKTVMERMQRGLNAVKNKVIASFFS